MRALITVLLATLLVASLAGCHHDRPLPKLVQLPDFTLTDQKGEPFHGHDLHGKIWVADFIYTSCTTFCPLLTEKMRSMRKRLADHRDAVRFVSISVDPEHDKPKALAKYARTHKAADDDWFFLTGDTPTVTDVVVKGFKAPMGKPQRTGPGDAYTILHARRFVVVDGSLGVRGYYGTASDDMDHVVDDVEQLVRQEAGS